MSIEEKIKTDFPLKNLTTFKIGGPAEFFLEITEREDLSEALSWAEAHQKPIFILGGASNILVSDAGVRGLVIKLSNSNLAVKGERIECGAGVNLNRVLLTAQGQNLSGLEWAVGIPQATIGGAIRGNAGAFGENMSDLVETVEAFNIKTGRMKIFSKKDCAFSYRRSIFVEQKHYIIWQAILKMFKGRGDEISGKIEKNLLYRRAKQPNLPSAGSVFKNIIWEDLKKVNSAMANTAQKNGLVHGGKIGAGWLIDSAGLKGQSVGDAKVSLEHANFIVNTGKATAADVQRLIEIIKKRVWQMFKVKLEEEIQYLGF